ncbi:cation:proton antiporter, partial [Candidatus Woesearchaeota archaeon]|nr:cation:proton antiporter [Candidatus Woesearchaeota archaeon]
CLFAAFLFSELAYRLKMPIVIGQMVAGILIGIPFITQYAVAENEPLIQVIADLGIIFLLFLAGLGISWNRMYGARGDIMLIALFGCVISFVLGFCLMKLLGYDTLYALIVGVCMSITAEGTNARVLMEMRKLRSKVGSMILGAGIIDDVIGLVLFVTISAALGETIVSQDLTYSPLEMIGFIAIIVVTFKLLPRLIKYEEREEGEMREVSLFMTAMLLCMLFAIFGQLITGTMTGSILAAFTAGVVIQLSLKHTEEHNIRRHFEIMALAFIIPFFFIGVGLNFDASLLVPDIPLFLMITAVAILGKLIGVFATKPFTKLSWKQLHLVGWAMNSRGAVELVIAFMALRAGLLTPPLYSAIVLMTITTTMIFPFVLKFMVKRDPKIMG